MSKLLDIRKIKSYVISLDKYRDKYAKLKKDIAHYDIHTNHFNAIWGKKLKQEYINTITDPSVQYSICEGRSLDNQIGTIGAVGCSLSHIELWNQLVDSDEDMWFILEDDCYPKYKMYSVHDLNTYINTVHALDPNWDMIYMGWVKPTFGDGYNKDILMDKPTDTTNSIGSIYKVNSFTHRTHAYIINRKGAIKLLKNAFPIIHQIDSYISFMCMHRDFNAYRNSIKYMEQRNLSGTGIQTDWPVKIYINRLSNKTVFICLCVFIIVFLLLFFVVLIVISKDLIASNYEYRARTS